MFACRIRRKAAPYACVLECRIYRSIKESSRKREETAHVCMCAGAGETDVVVNASLSAPSLTSIKDYRHMKATAESTHRQFQMPEFQ